MIKSLANEFVGHIGKDFRIVRGGLRTDMTSRGVDAGDRLQRRVEYFTNRGQVARWPREMCEDRAKTEECGEAEQNEIDRSRPAGWRFCQRETRRRRRARQLASPRYSAERNLTLDISR